MNEPQDGTKGLSPRLAAGAFAVYVAVAWWFLIYGIGSHSWFLRDDWKFLAGRDGGSLHDVLRAHDVHPAVIPVLIFRVMFNVFGLWFTPYLVLIVTMHLVVVILLRVVMRRAGVHPWLATIAASMLVLFGPGEQNIHWAFQINFVLALIFGLVQLILLDHDGPLDRRDLAGAAAGVGAVLCSGIGPLMVVAVALAALARRGWRVAAAHTAPAALTYLLWWIVAQPAGYDFGRPSLGVIWDWVREGETGTIEALGHLSVVSALLLVVLVAGLALMLVEGSVEDLRRRLSVAAGLLLSGPVFFVLTAQGRWTFGLDLARSSRYLYVAAVCVLPALAVAADAVARRWRPAGFLVAGLLVAGVPGNARGFDTSPLTTRQFEIHRQVILALPRTAEATAVPRWVRPIPDPKVGDDLTIGWLLDALHDGHLPAPGPPDPKVVARFPITLGLAQIKHPFEEGHCVTRTDPIDLDLEKGDRLGIRSPIAFALVADGKVASPGVGFGPGAGGTLSVELPHLHVRVSPFGRRSSYTLCR